MGYVEVTLIAIGLAMDAFTVCVVSGVKIKNPTGWHYFRLAFHFGFFQFMMPLTGYYGGVLVEVVIKKYDHWIAFILLLFIGLKMIWESMNHNDEEGSIKHKDPSRGTSLITLSIATSIDAAAVGFSFAALQIPIFVPAVSIGFVCVAFSAIGLFIGNRIGVIAGPWAERVGGLILIVIGIKILIDHIYYMA